MSRPVCRYWRPQSVVAVKRRSRISVLPPRAGRSTSSAADIRTSRIAATNIARQWIDRRQARCRPFDYADLQRSARGLQYGEGERKKERHLDQSGGASADITARPLHAEHAWSLRHIHDRQRHRQARDQGGGRYLVLPDTPITPRSPLERDTACGSSPPLAGKVREGSNISSTPGLLVVPDCRPNHRKRSGRARQCRRRHHQTRSRGLRIRDCLEGAQKLAALLPFHQ